MTQIIMMFALALVLGYFLCKYDVLNKIKAKLTGKKCKKPSLDDVSSYVSDPATPSPLSEVNT